ncbi:sulfatase-like hydrolase/transferase [Tissierella sp. MSJ-40]|uniref:Sulfatase-like hydrolase/transferase n=1 Tax=Tissierella simiarum TaxID=2841534 RepID=A0ABS6E265_9FIRM|nr:sulfatase-like hydrolase/transferase [Tissierella simiarum]MBU5437000.1 sulfatase-like hydrolase/transferase [Tissierella simiarum]
MLLSILLILKVILFINVTHVEFNKITIFLISSFISLFFLSIIYFSNNKKKQTVAFTFYSFVSIIMFVDAVYYTYFNALPSVAMLKQLNQVAAVGDSVKSLLSIRTLLFIIDIPILIFYLKKKKSKIEEENIKYGKNVRIGVPAVIGIMIVVLLTSLGYKGQLDSIKAQEVYSYHISDIKYAISGDPTHVAEGRGILTKEDLDELKERTQLKDGKLTGIGKDKNLIVLQVESLQNFVIDLHYDGQEVTPNLNKLIKDKSSIYYDRYYQLLGRGNTSDAEFVSHNSVYPSMEESSYVQYENNTFYGLPKILKDNGYTPWAFHGYKKEFWNRANAYVNQGFERFVSEEDYKIGETLGFGLGDEDFFHQSIDYLKELDSKDDNPFYAFMVTLTSHNPYKMPEKYHEISLRDEHKDTILGNYLQSIHYTDKYIGEFIERLKEEGLYDNTVLALYGDHFAIASVNKDVQELMSNFLEKDYDYDTMMNIPLIVHVPGEEINETISKMGSQLDFLPTMLNIMGYKNEKGLMFGRDLTNYKDYNFIAQQTYMQKGSFMDEDKMFVIARDGIFDHSKAIKLDTREELDISQFRGMYEKVIDEINKSDFILKKDILKELLQNNGEIDFDQLQGPDIANKNYIKNSYYNSLEELNKSYEEGYRLLAVDLQWTRDDEIVLLKDWYWFYNNLFENPKDHLFLDEFKNMKMVDDQTQMTMEDLAKWMKEHEDAYVVLRTTEEKDNLLMKVKEDYPDLRFRFIPEIKYFDHYFTLSFRGFRNIILNLTETEYSEDEVLDFLNMHPHFGVAISEKQAKSGLAKKIEKVGVNSYVDSINKERKVKKLERKGVYGVFTDDILPKK